MPTRAAVALLVVGLAAVTVDPVESSVPGQGRAWTRTGDRIVFFLPWEGVAESREIYAVDPDGTNLVQLTDNAVEDGNPAWSPDGTAIVFFTRTEAGLRLVTMGRGGSSRTILPCPVDHCYSPDWHPDGEWLAFEGMLDGRMDIYVMRLDGSQARRVSESSERDGRPAWSADGATIAFFSTRDGNEEIYVMRADGSAVRRITNHSASDYNPVWFPGRPASDLRVCARWQ